MFKKPQPFLSRRLNEKTKTDLRHCEMFIINTPRSFAEKLEGIRSLACKRHYNCVSHNCEPIQLILDFSWFLVCVKSQVQI